MTVTNDIDPNTAAALEQQIDEAKREKDPQYSLQRGKEDWGNAISELAMYLGDHGNDEPVKVHVELQRLLMNATSALRRVQDDIRRVNAVDNAGWVPTPRTRKFYPRIVRSDVEDDELDED